MVVLPITSFGLSLCLAFVTLRRFIERRRAHEAVWSATFMSFAAAAGAELLGSLLGWTELLARVYYLAGATLSVGYLAVGTLYLLAPRPIAVAGLIVVLVQSTAGVLLVWRAPVDPATLATAGWSALEKRGELIALAITINALGTIVVVGGALVSAWLLWRGRGPLHQAAGIALIGVGTLVIALGGTLTRLGRHEYLYAAMAPGLLLIFVGYLAANSRGRSAETAPASARSP